MIIIIIDKFYSKKMKNKSEARIFDKSINRKNIRGENKENKENKRYKKKIIFMQTILKS